jgi:hypothetical protein
MPTVNLSALAGAGQQFFDNNGNPLSGGKLYSYEAGTTTPQATYTNVNGTTAHTNPIVLDSAGRVATGEIWVTASQNYKFVLKTSTEVTIATWDNITGINGTGIATNAEFVAYDPPFANSVSTNVEAKLAEYVSIQDFGASPSATAAANTAAIQAAIDSGVKNILVPKGNYSFVPPLSVNSDGVSLIGDGYSVSVLTPTAVAAPAIHVGRVANSSGFTMQGLRIRGNSTCTAGLELGTIGGFYAIVIDILKCRIDNFGGTNASGIKLNYGFWINVKQNTLLDYNYYGFYIPANAVVTTLQFTENTEIQSSLYHGFFSEFGALVDAVTFDGASIEISEYSAIFSTSAATNYVIVNSYFEINGQNASSIGTIVVNSLDPAPYKFARVFIDNNQFQVTTNGDDIFLAYVQNSQVSNNNGIASIETTAASDVYFENNQGNGALDALALYKTLLGRINAFERQPTTGYWQNYSSDRFSLSDTHFAIQQTTKPTAVVQASAGVGATVAVADGSTDNQGRLDLTPGTSPTFGDAITVTFNKTFTTTPLAVVVSYGNYVASGPAVYAAGVNATSFKIGFNGTPVAGLQYINYIIIGGQ